MTLEEKAAQLCGDLPGSFIVDGKVSIDALREKFPNGHGRLTQYSMVGIVDPVQIAEISNELQHYFVEETRLGILCCPPDRKPLRLSGSGRHPVSRPDQRGLHLGTGTGR